MKDLWQVNQVPVLAIVDDAWQRTLAVLLPRTRRHTRGDGTVVVRTERQAGYSEDEFDWIDVGTEVTA